MPQINYLAVFLAAVAAMAVGSLWYSLKSPTGKIWLKELGFKEPTAEEQKKMASAMMKSMSIYFIGVMITMYVYFHMLATYQTVTYSMALQGAFWTWLGFFAAPGMSPDDFERKSWKLLAVNQSYNLVLLIIAALIFVAMG